MGWYVAPAAPAGCGVHSVGAHCGGGLHPPPHPNPACSRVPPVNPVGACQPRRLRCHPQRRLRTPDQWGRSVAGAIHPPHRPLAGAGLTPPAGGGEGARGGSRPAGTRPPLARGRVRPSPPPPAGGGGRCCGGDGDGGGGGVRQNAGPALCRPGLPPARLGVVRPRRGEGPAAGNVTAASLRGVRRRYCSAARGERGGGGAVGGGLARQ